MQRYDDTEQGGGAGPSPINPLPPVVIVLFAAIMAVEAMFTLGAQGLAGGPQAIGWRLGAIQTYAFSADIFQWMLANGRWPAEHLLRFVSFPFVHANFTHALFAGIMVLALGKFVGEAFRGWAVLVVFFGASIGGAVIYGMIVSSGVPLIGAFPGVYGLIGAFTYVLWLRLGQEGGPVRWKCGLDRRSGWLCLWLRAVLRRQSGWLCAAARQAASRIGRCCPLDI